MLSRERKICVFIVIKLNPRKTCSDMTKRAALINLTLGMNISMTVGTFVKLEIGVVSSEVTLLTVNHHMFSIKRKPSLGVAL